MRAILERDLFDGLGKLNVGVIAIEGDPCGRFGEVDGVGESGRIVLSIKEQDFFCIAQRDRPPCCRESGIVRIRRWDGDRKRLVGATVVDLPVAVVVKVVAADLGRGRCIGDASHFACRWVACRSACFADALLLGFAALAGSLDVIDLAVAVIVDPIAAFGGGKDLVFTRRPAFVVAAFAPFFASADPCGSFGAAVAWTRKGLSIGVVVDLAVAIVVESIADLGGG